MHSGALHLGLCCMHACGSYVRSGVVSQRGGEQGWRSYLAREVVEILLFGLHNECALVDRQF